MNKSGFLLPVLLLATVVALASTKPKEKLPAPPKPAQQSDLETVLTQMDKGAAAFHSVEADFQWDQFTKVVNDTDVQKGQLYLRRHGENLEAGIMITSPAKKQITFKKGKLRICEPNLDQITEPDVSKNKEGVESFMRLGFGERGHDLLQSYDVTMAGWEIVDGVRTAKLELAARTPRVRNMFSKIIWWIDPVRDVSIRQQLFQPAGDYRLAHYSNIKLNANPAQDFFNSQCSSHSKIVKP